MPQGSYWVYILASDTGTLYVGVTNDLERRVAQHKSGEVDGFTKRYSVHRLVYFEETSDIRSALEREKELKGWRRSRKLALIMTDNPMFTDLSEG